MLEIIFGWRKASKCKKLIRKVQCRLKLLMNKRSTIVRQLRDDIGQLLKHGHYQSAFNRVEQLYKDECIVLVYDMLDNFCEFIKIQLSYIRRHKDCPNDINEAISSLIFASARCGDLPELRVIRKLFGERYGQQFVSTALDLLPGHLVNDQIRENLSISSVNNEVKYKLVDEIARSCLKSGPLALEYTSELHLQQAKENDKLVLSHEHEANKTELGGKIVNIDISQEREIFEEPATRTSQEIIKKLDCPQDHNEGNNDNESSSSDDLSNAHEEIIYLDDIEEFPSPMNKDENGQDQRVFIFKSLGISTREKYEAAYDTESEYEENYDQSWMKTNTKIREKRTKDRKAYVGHLKLEHPCIVKIGNEFVEGEFVCFKDETNQEVNHNCSLENPCYHSINKGEEEEEFEDQLSEMKIMKMDSTNISMCSCSTENSPAMNEAQPPYLRAITMPVSRTKECRDDGNIGRSNSFPYEQPSRFSTSSPHVHPKLPDYDELAAKFMALKQSQMQNQ